MGLAQGYRFLTKAEHAARGTKASSKAVLAPDGTVVPYRKALNVQAQQAGFRNESQRHVFRANAKKQSYKVMKHIVYSNVPRDADTIAGLCAMTPGAKSAMLTITDRNSGAHRSTLTFDPDRDGADYGIEEADDIADSYDMENVVLGLTVIYAK